MHEFTLMSVSMDGEKEVGRFTAADTKDACRKHMDAWNQRQTSHAIVLVLPNGTRHSYRDSAVYVAAD